MTRAMVSAAQPEAVEAGLDVLRAGGNVIDAAIGAALVQTVVDPQMCGIAGFGSMHICLPSRGVHTVIDFHGRAPLPVHLDLMRPEYALCKPLTAAAQCGRDAAHVAQVGTHTNDHADSPSEASMQRR